LRGRRIFNAAALLRLGQHPLRQGGHALLLLVLVLVVPQPKLMESEMLDYDVPTSLSKNLSL
jgi:hypothetical protein